MHTQQPQEEPWAVECYQRQAPEQCAAGRSHDGVPHLCRRVPPWHGSAGLWRSGRPIGAPPCLSPLPVKLTTVHLKKELPSVHPLDTYQARNSCIIDPRQPSTYRPETIGQPIDWISAGRLKRASSLHRMKRHHPEVEWPEQHQRRQFRNKQREESKCLHGCVLPACACEKRAP